MRHARVHHADAFARIGKQPYESAIVATWVARKGTNLMDPKSDEIDPTWWEEPLADTAAEEYWAPELLSPHLERAAKEAEAGQFQQLVLGVLAMASSAMLKPENWLEPFSPAIQFGANRSVLPSDLNHEQVALLARLAPLIERPDLRARVADVAWFYGDRSNVALLDAAIGAYRAAPLTDKSWPSVGRAAWQRAFDLVNRRGADGHALADDMTRELKESVLTGTVADGYRVAECAKLLRANGRLDAEARNEIATALAALAAKTVDPRMNRRLEREAAAWLGSSDAAAAIAAIERVGRTYIDEADARVAADPAGGALVEGHFLEKAIATLRTLPRVYRLEHGVENLIDDLRNRLHESREMALESMRRIESDPVDLTDAVSFARERVSGHSDPFHALAAFATLVPPMDADRTHEAAERVVADSIHHLFASSTFARDARKVAASPGIAGGPDEATIWSEVVRNVMFHSQLVSKGVIQPAQEVLTLQHRYDREYMTTLCRESSTVPEGHAELWGAGLAFGLAGDYGAAVAVIVPQLEQIVRTLLKRRGAHTLHVDDLTGVESEKSLNALLDMNEATEVFGSGMVMELKALLIFQGGPNLRNDIAHGLLDDEAAWSYTSMYLWWFCLRLVMWPVIQMAHESTIQTENSADNSKDDTTNAAPHDAAGEPGPTKR